MIVYGNHEVPHAGQMMSMLTDMLWRKTMGEQDIEQTIQGLQQELHRAQEDMRDAEFRLMGLDEKYGVLCGDLTLMEARAIEAEQDRDSWKAAYYSALDKVPVDDGKRPVDPFGKDGAYGGLGGTQSG